MCLDWNLKVLWQIECRCRLQKVHLTYLYWGLFTIAYYSREPIWHNSPITQRWIKTQDFNLSLGVNIPDKGVGGRDKFAACSLKNKIKSMYVFFLICIGANLLCILTCIASTYFYLELHKICMKFPNLKADFGFWHKKTMCLFLQCRNYFFGYEFVRCLPKKAPQIRSRLVWHNLIARY